MLLLSEDKRASPKNLKNAPRWIGNTWKEKYLCKKPTRCTNFTNLFCHETLHVSDSSSVHHQEFIHCTLSNGIRDLTLKFAYLILEELFVVNLYQLDKYSTKFTIWKYWKSCVKKLDGNDPYFLSTTHGSCITTIHLLTWHCLWASF